MLRNFLAAQTPRRLIVSACLAVLGLAGLIFFGSNGDYFAGAGVLVLLNMVLAVSLRPVLLGGEASFAHGAFFAIGGYGFGILTTRVDVDPWLALIAAGVIGAIAAFIVGIFCIRSTGATFFVMTFAFLMLIMAFFEYATDITGGFDGIAGIKPLFGPIDTIQFYWLTALLVAVVFALFFILDRSIWGYRLRALGESYALAASVGIGRAGNLLFAFTLGSGVAAIAGAFFASFITYISPDSFSFWLSIYVLTYIIVGGIRSIVGSLVGAAIVGILPIVSGWSDAVSGIFESGATLIVLMALPAGVVIGLMGRARKRATAARDDDEPIDSGRVDVGAAVRELESRPPGSPMSPPGNEILRVDGLGRAFGGVLAVEGVSFGVREGEIVGIIGPNGAGKTTLLNMISGFMRPTKGTVTWKGADVSSVPGHKLSTLGVTRTFQASAVFGKLTVRENLMVSDGGVGHGPAYFLRPMVKDKQAAARVGELLELFRLENWADTRAADLPYGIRRVLGVAIAMATRPQLVCLDEPLAGLSDSEATALMDLVSSLRARMGLTIIIIEHRLPPLVRVCDRMIGFDAGRLIVSGTASEVLGHPEIVSAYLGKPMELTSNER